MASQDGDNTSGRRQTHLLPSTTVSIPFPGNTLKNLLSPQKDAVTASSGRSSNSISSETDSTANVRDLAPWEVDTCQQLIDQIRNTTEKNLYRNQPDGRSPRAIDATLKEAAITIQFNAKWFSERQLEELICAALDAVGTSTSSSDTSATIKLIEAILTYSYLPQCCLKQVVRFIAQAYHATRRAFKTQRLALAIFKTFQKLRSSHLGGQVIAMLLENLDTADETVLNTNSGFAQAAGALQLVSQELETDSTALIDVDIAGIMASLSGVIAKGPPDLCEDVLETISSILENIHAVKVLDDILGWDGVLHALQIGLKRLPARREGFKVVQQALMLFDHFEIRHYQVLAEIIISSRSPIDQKFVNEMTIVATSLSHSATRASLTQFDTLVRFLTTAGFNLDLLDTILSVNLPVILDLSTSEDIEQFLRGLKEISDDPNTITQAIELFARHVAHMLRRSIALDQRHLELLFELCCESSLESQATAEIVLAVRADVDHQLYLNSPHASCNFANALEFRPLFTWERTILAAVQNVTKWTTYHLFTSRLASLLSNHSLFKPRINVIKELRSIVSTQLKDGNYAEPPSDSGTSKSDVAKALVAALVTIMSYHEHLTKAEIVNTISTFLSVAGTRDYSLSVYCIHALSACCYEVPITTGSYMDDIIDKMAKMVTQKLLAIHVLQFLAGLSRLPDLFRNFKEHDYKKIFGVCGSYLQSTRGLHLFNQEHTKLKGTDSAEHFDTSEAMPQYVYALAHHVICFWYIAIKPKERKSLKSYITNCLRYHNPNGSEIVEDQGLVTIDLMDAMDANEEDRSESFHFYDVDGEITALHRIVGNILISTETALHGGRSIINIRRPSGLWKRFLRSNLDDPQVCRSISVEYDYDQLIPVVPNSAESWTYGQLQIPKSSSLLGTPGMHVLEHSAELTRAIQALDRISGLDSHKAGIIYVGEAQRSELEVLQNCSGSPDFWELIGSLGEIRKLRGATFNTHGLDRENDMDGASTIVWENDLTQLVFHIPLLMPKQSDSIVNKKRHIGNNAVNIIFNNAGFPFDFETLPTQVTQAYIVISPSDRTSFLQARNSSSLDNAAQSAQLRQRVYTVQVITRPGYPAVSSAHHAKTVSGQSLPLFIRNLVLNECIFALMWAHRDDGPGEFPSSWRARLHQIRRMRERYAGSTA